MAGLATGLGGEDGLGEPAADGLGEGVGARLAIGEGVDLGLAVGALPQPSSANSATTATTPNLTGY